VAVNPQIPGPTNVPTAPRAMRAMSRSPEFSLLGREVLEGMKGFQTSCEEYFPGLLVLSPEALVTLSP
jgi:hypothetical protein